MDEDSQAKAWYKNPWVYVFIAPAVITVGGVLFEYVVAKPVENQPPMAILVRFGSLLVRAAPWVIGVILLMWLIKSVVQKSGRAWWARRWEGLAGLRFRDPFTTAKRRRALARREAEQRRDLNRLKFEEGYSKRSAEVDAERASVRKPDWSIEPKEQNGQIHYYLYNYGYRVSKVRLTAPDADFDFEGFPPRFTDPFTGAIGGGYSGKFFEGHPTDKGLCDGVEFTVHWVDELGDPQEDVKRVEPKDLKRSDLTDESYKRGYVEGFAAAAYAGEDV